MKRIMKLASWLVVGACVFIALTAEAEIKMRRLGYLPGAEVASYANAVSARGSVVVGEAVTNDMTFVAEGFHWRGWNNGFEETMTGLGVLAGDDMGSSARAVSADGTIVVGNSLSMAGSRAFIWEDGVMTEFPALDANDVSADGRKVVGSHFNTDGWTEAYLWDNDELVRLGDLDGGYDYSIAHAISADGSTVVGVGHTSGGIGASGTKAFRYYFNDEENKYIMESLGELNQGEASMAYGVSADGSVIVGYSGFRGFRWEDGSMIPLEPLQESGFQESIAYDVSGDGSVVVGYSYNDQIATGQEAVFWSERNGWNPVSLNHLMDGVGIDRQRFWMIYAKGVCDNGITVVGTGTDTNDWTNEAFLVTIVDSWGGREIVDDVVDTDTWLGELVVRHHPWIWCRRTNSWVLIPEEVAQEGDGWIHTPDTSTLELERIPGTDYSYSKTVKKWFYDTDDANDRLYMISSRR